MKKTILAAFMVAIIITANAQSESTFRPFKFDISAGYALPASSSTYGSSGGFLIAFEPKYALNDIVCLGLKVETSVAVSGNDEVKASVSYLATGDFYLNTNTVRPFVGAGIGIFGHASANANSSDNIIGYTRFGGAPRIGVEIAHFRAALEYNFAGKVADVSKNYLGIKLGVLIGGGRIRD